MGGLFDINSISKRIIELEKAMEREDFWDDYNNANKINKEYSDLKKTLNNYNNLKDSLETLELLQNEMSEDEFSKELDLLNEKIMELELHTYLNGEYDKLNCYLEIHPGAGGTEACDWASMLKRMYERFCDNFDFKYETIYELKGDEAGISRATLLISGINAFGYLKHESGVHRLVRISPFDAGRRRHTSFASVKVIPEFNEAKEIVINEEDLKIDVFHSSGAGGQSVNTSNSAVRITHLPTKIVVNCQNERSQLKNKEKALQILQNKLYELKLEEERKQQEKFNQNDKNIEFGSQIRSYVLEPYKLVKDNRSNFESNEPGKILEGEIIEMLEFNLKNIK